MKGTENDMTTCNAAGEYYGMLIANSSGCFYLSYSDSSCTTNIYSMETMKKEDSACEEDDDSYKKTYCSGTLPTDATDLGCITAASMKTAMALDDNSPTCSSECGSLPTNCAEMETAMSSRCASS